MVTVNDRETSDCKLMWRELSLTSFLRNHFEVDFSDNSAIITAERHFKYSTLSLLKGKFWHRN